MSRKRLFLAAFLAASALVLSTADAQIRGVRGTRSNSARVYGARVYSAPNCATRGSGSSYGYGPRNDSGVSIYGFGIGGY
jgi:hypothetical protein